ncbi:DUF6728 family protein [Fulvivirga ulvae]|uniref:DUF6728 family protein n=1 Tax=Fulvivirga ulvae TaxID=2904245 RepID=UPI00279550E4|nr:DUF6728 family protein [Fulvivirga ulvae]
MNNDSKMREDSHKNSLKDYFALGEVFGYFFRKKDPSRPSSVNLKMMHGINKISMIIFLIAIIVLIARHLF